jgi:hypothetical protein
MIRIGSTIPISEQAVVADGVLIGSTSVISYWDGRNTERNVAQSGFEDALGIQEWHSLALKLKPPRKHIALDDAGIASDRVQKGKGRQTNACIAVGQDS